MELHEWILLSVEVSCVTLNDKGQIEFYISPVLSGRILSSPHQDTFLVLHNARYVSCAPQAKKQNKSIMCKSPKPGNHLFPIVYIYKSLLLQQQGRTICQPDCAHERGLF